jgi:hypothetical protein
VSFCSSLSFSLDRGNDQHSRKLPQ